MNSVANLKQILNNIQYLEVDNILFDNEDYQENFSKASIIINLNNYFYKGKLYNIKLKIPATFPLSQFQIYLIYSLPEMKTKVDLLKSYFLMFKYRKDDRENIIFKYIEEYCDTGNIQFLELDEVTHINELFNHSMKMMVTYSQSRRTIDKFESQRDNNHFYHLYGFRTEDQMFDFCQKAYMQKVQGIQFFKSSS
jgi:hypothetical protein